MGTRAERVRTFAQTLRDTRQVNLVSEHIWCEDFLVRSFYLKNVQTQETRTLTQFHFLSWPAEGTPASTRPLLDFRRWASCQQSPISNSWGPKSGLEHRP